MLCTPNAPAVRAFSSTFSFPKRTSVRSEASCSMTGAMIRHGPHHAAQKSTTHLPPASDDWKFASVSVTTSCPPSASSVALHFPHTAFFPLPRGGTRLACPQEGQRTTTSVVMLPATAKCVLGRHGRQRWLARPAARERVRTRVVIRNATRDDLPSLRALFARA